MIENIPANCFLTTNDVWAANGISTKLPNATCEIVIVNAA
jgi:hypothetical protein